MFSLNIYDYNSFKIDKTYQKFEFFFQFQGNSKNFKKSLGHLGVKGGIKDGIRLLDS